MGRKILSGILFLIIFSAAAAAAQDTAAVAVYAEGYSFFVSREGGSDEEYYDVLYDEVIGMEFHEGDYISTDEGTFLEVQLLPSGNLLKISENTSFLIGGLGSGGGGQFNVTYGRVRAKVDRLTGKDQFKLYGPSVVAGVRGTDFGYDIIASASAGESGTLVQVYCFEGEVEVSKIKAAALAGPEEIADEVLYDTVIIRTDEMVTLGAETEPELQKFAPRTIEQEIRNFWNEHDFSGSQLAVDGQDVVTEPDGEPEYQEPEKQTVSPPDVFTDEDEKALQRRRYVIGGTTLLGLGVILEAVGIAAVVFGEALFPAADPAAIQTFGRAFMITGGGFALGSLLTYLGALQFK